MRLAGRAGQDQGHHRLHQGVSSFPKRNEKLCGRPLRVGAGVTCINVYFESFTLAVVSKKTRMEHNSRGKGGKGLKTTNNKCLIIPELL